MKVRRMAAVSSVAYTAAFISVSGCGYSGPPRIYPDRPDPRAGENAIKLYDTDKDRFLDAKELEEVPGLKAAIKQVDLDKDGKISAAEISARIQAWANSKIGRLAVSCRITHNGAPLTGATVKLVPERFLGGQVQMAEGTTDSHGVAAMKTAGQRGVCPGFYRVEITKTGETIPAKYNTETRLGQEAANDASGIENGIATFDLEY
jgi:EF hand